MATPSFNLGQISQGIQQFTKPLGGAVQTLTGEMIGIYPLLSLLFPELASNPAFTNALRQAAGTQMTEELRPLEPVYQRPTSTGTITTVPGPSGAPMPVNLQTIAGQASAERRAAFTAGQSLQSAQQAQTTAARRALESVVQSGARMDRLLAQEQQAGARTLQAGLAGVERLRGTVASMVRSAFTVGAGLLREVRTQAGNIRDSFTADIAARVASLSEGVNSAARANYDEHIRTIEGSSGPLSPEERAAIKMYYATDAAKQTSLAVGQLHEAAAEFKATLDSNLLTTQTAMSQQVLQQGVGAVVSGMATLSQAENMAVNLRQTAVDNSRLLAVQRQELSTLVGQLRLQGEGALFDMVSNTTYPVAIFSDILSGVFDMAWDIMSYDNNLQNQELANRLFVLNPQHAALSASLSGVDSSRMFNEQMETQQEALRSATEMGWVNTGANVVSSFIPFTGKSGNTSPTTSPSSAYTPPESGGSVG